LGEGVVTRLKDRRLIPPYDDVVLDLIVAPAEGHEHPPERLTELEVAWLAYRDRILEECGDVDWKPWGWSAFEARAPERPG
jgi:hypothetical protein